ncbi:DNA polymerase beta domain protein region [Anaeromyxobacter sp. K]|uniref:nucleotidyltransferase domain-containing protein n=1 Tax=Anaeromyxobacter sp. (strain K) TaxID=447217 RepID=UPI00015F9099|nr:nucleotidyltransferase domain-containing protein [Anaeromyxobacter sp. K]ACG72773.1 DNA polymerase beta domain protein region [Anaeromyxobacter sp. K]
MNVDPKTTIAGVPILRVRDALRRLGPGRYMTDRAEFLAHRLKVPREQAEQVGEALALQGLIERHERHDDWWRLTPGGGRLCNATGLRRIPRAKAEVLVAALLDRAGEVNRAPRFLVAVRRIRVFGSYTTGAPDLADIDLVVELERKEPDQQRFEALRNERARADGRVFRDFLDELGWPEEDVKKFLRNRSPYLSLHGAHDKVADAAAKTVIFDSTTRSPSRKARATAPRPGATSTGGARRQR